MDNQKDIVVVGAGGQGREVMWQLNELNKETGNYNILGFIDADPALKEKVINGFPVIGNEEWLLSRKNDTCVIICIANPKTRKKIYQKLKINPSLSFPNFFAKNVTCSEFVTFGQGGVFCPADILTVNIKVGDFVIINSACTIGHDTVIEDFVTIYPGAVISGNVRIGAECEIGTGAKIIQGKTIGANTVIGAGAVVTKDLPPDCTAVGVPAKVKL
ncbi:MAG: acetyltransferase [Lachnospiraceae bacterium]|nr:acetyltransferase [Lachnospiraceae bacterium]